MAIKTCAPQPLLALLLGVALQGTAPAAPGDIQPQWVLPAVTAPRLQYHTFDSAAVRTKVSYFIYTPEVYDTEKERRFPVLYWLHGSGGGLPGVPQLVAHFDAAIRAGKTPPMLVVFANGLPQGMWCDSKDGKTPVETIVIKELLPHIDATFRTLAGRAGRIVEGFSMGGYGAARLGFKYSDLFAAVSMLAAGPLDLELAGPRASANPGEREEILQAVYGGDLAHFRAQSPWVLAEQNAAALRDAGKIRMAVGEQDFTLALNRDVDAHLTRLGVPHTFTVPPGVEHNPMALLTALGEGNWQFYRDTFGGGAPPAAVAGPPAAGATAAPQPPLAAAYDPLALPAGPAVPHVDATVRDTTRQRDIPLRLYLPTTPVPAPVVLFSHGLGGTREGSAFLGEHWAARGYVAVFLQHPGSDDSVWKDQPRAERMAAMNGAASGQNFLLRVKDVPAVLDQLARWHKEAGYPLCGRLDLSHIGMSGHSFGAVTTQAVSGQAFLGGRTPFTDARIGAALAFSPSSPRRGDPAAAFGAVRIPWLLMTGTQDVSPIGDIDVASRLAVFPALPPDAAYELVLDGAEHSAFTDRALPGDRAPRNPNHHRAILALSTAFWDAYLRRDPAALAWLQEDGPRAVLEERDRWQRK
jgi:predicted dienelactone hydrolase/enterochelin esterase-like enzyme